MTSQKPQIMAAGELPSEQETSARDPFLNQTHSVMEEKGKGVQIALHTDGCSKGYLQASDNRGFSGWGFYIRGSSFARESEWTRYGGMPNASSTEAEFFAVLKGLKEIKFPANLTLITDCSRVVDCLVHKEASLSRLAEIESIAPSDRKKSDWMDFASLKIFERICEETENNPKILSLDVRWVRSHTLDELGTLPDISTIESEDERNHLQWRLGNFKADQQATDGAKKAVRNAIWNFRHRSDDPEALGRHMALCRKNFMYSRFVRDEAISYLSDKPGFIPRQIVEDVLPQDDAEQVLMSWDQLERNSNPFSETRGGSRPQPAPARPATPDYASDYSP